MNRLAKLLIVLTLIFSVGAHWMILQSIAWSGMILSYSQDFGFSEALTKTFDGKHPCRLCKAIHEGKASEKKQDHQKIKLVSKLDLGIPWQGDLFDFTFERFQIPFANSYANARNLTPPKPFP